MEERLDPRDEKKKQIRENTDLLVNRAMNGDQEAIGSLYNLFVDRLEASVRSKVGPKLRGQIDTHDLIQSVWGDVLSDFGRFEYEGPESFFQWLLARLVTKIKSKGRYYSREKRDPDRTRTGVEKDPLSGEVPLPPAPDPTPSHRAIDRERFLQLQDVLERFPEIQRQVLILRLRDELSFEKIGVAIEKKPDAARMLYGRSLKKLLEAMQRQDSPSNNKKEKP